MIKQEKARKLNLKNLYTRAIIDAWSKMKFQRCPMNCEINLDIDNKSSYVELIIVNISYYFNDLYPFSILASFVVQFCH